MSKVCMRRRGLACAAITTLLYAVSANASSVVRGCGDPRLVQKIDAPIVVTVTLQDDSKLDEQLPIFGKGDEKFMWVTARFDHVNKGDFRLPVGSSFRLTVHSIALSFGYDHGGEQYLIGLRPLNHNDYDIVGFSPIPSGLIAFNGEVLNIEHQRSNSVVINVSPEPNWFVTVRITDVDHPVGVFQNNAKLELGIYATAQMTNIGERVCFVVISRPTRMDAPFRLIEIMHP